MKKEETIRRYGEAAYEKWLAQKQAWVEAHPENVRKNNRMHSRKGGRGYARKLIYGRTGIPGEKNKIRALHSLKWRQYKNIIAPNSQLHHQWEIGTAKYTGLALVEADSHMHGFINVIKILKGGITLFTEKEIREQEVR